MFQKLALLVITLLMLMAVFWQNRSDEFSKPTWLEDGNGLYFDGQSFIYADRFPESHQPNMTDVCITLSIKPEFPKKPHLGIIMELSDRSKEHFIVVSQWEKSLLVLNNEDFSNHAKKPKIYAPLPQDDRIHDILIQSGLQGTQVYIDGILKGRNKKLKLRLPQLSNGSYVVVGNGVRARNPWTGSIHALEIHRLPPQPPDKKFLTTNGSPQLIYKFNEGSGSQIRDHSPNMVNLMIPDKPVVIQISVLDLPSNTRLKEPWMKRDLILNFLGFIPFGFLLCRLLSGVWNKSAVIPLLVSFTISFLFSLSIELTQVLLPQRNSSLLDLILNSGGGLCGASLAVLLGRLQKKRGLTN